MVLGASNSPLFAYSVAANKLSLGGKCISEQTTTYPYGSCGDPGCYWPLWFIDVIHS